MTGTVSQGLTRSIRTYANTLSGFIKTARGEISYVRPLPNNLVVESTCVPTAKLEEEEEEEITMMIVMLLQGSSSFKNSSTTEHVGINQVLLGERGCERASLEKLFNVPRRSLCVVSWRSYFTCNGETQIKSERRRRRSVCGRSRRGQNSEKGIAIACVDVHLNF